MLFSRSSSRTRGNLPATITTMVCVLAAVGCGGAESPFAPDFGVEETPRLSTAGEPPSAGEPPAAAIDGPPPPGGEVADSSVTPAVWRVEPGEPGPIMLRGPTSINTICRSTPPLIVIDGVMQPEDSRLSDIGAPDIDHVEIVKGAAATVLYGPRGQNGVIDIRTKHGI
ncbi:TonB-dependent receptor plug domain-containing protein [Candidatus Palauibacter sp.]|uniref:TonB-dependent receptor plug domain-containing protein n=1 Tax=Candidatus Palauibacter sp. TaxID=3101350 RepID=UPI003C6FDA97